MPSLLMSLQRRNAPTGIRLTGIEGFASQRLMSLDMLFE
jgi:hypothetical protein